MNLFEFQPAGQGLFYTGSLAYGTYHFVYDCGTENRIEYLRSRIDSYVDSLKRGTEKPVIDFLVISHLHKDHFSGVYDLLQKADVKKIYLPYLGEDRQTIKFLLAYAVFANGGETDGGAAEDAPNGEEAEQNLELFSLMCGMYGVGEGGGFARYRERAVFLRGEEEGQPNGACVVCSRSVPVSVGGNPYWEFSFFGKHIPLQKYLDLNEKLDRQIQASGVTLGGYLAAAPENIAKIADIYRSVFKGNNVLNDTSILLAHRPLYHGPCPFYFDKNLSVTAWHNFRKNYPDDICACQIMYENSIRGARSAGTLLTGDAKIDEGLGALLPAENFILQVPHHGSLLNWKQFRKRNISSEVYVIPFGYGNKYCLPSMSVINDLMDNKRKFFPVTQKESFAYAIE